MDTSPDERGHTFIESNIHKESASNSMSPDVGRNSSMTINSIQRESQTKLDFG